MPSCVWVNPWERQQQSHPTCVRNTAVGTSGRTKICTFPAQSDLRAWASPPLPTLEEPHSTRRKELHPFCFSQNSLGYQYFLFNSALKADLPKSTRAWQLCLGLVHSPPTMTAVMACCRWLKINYCFQDQLFQPRLLSLVFYMCFGKMTDNWRCRVTPSQSSPSVEFHPHKNWNLSLRQCCTLTPNLPLLCLLSRDSSGKPEVQGLTFSSSFLAVLNSTAL